MKRKVYTIKDFQISRIIAISVSILYCMISVFLAILNHKITVNVSEEILTVGVLWWLLLPLIMILSWYMCIERYLVIEFRKLGEQDTMSKRVWYYIAMVLLSATGVAVYMGFRDAINYVMENRELLDELGACICMNFGICVMWATCLFCGFHTKKRIVQAEEVRKKIIIVGCWAGLILAILLVQESIKYSIYDKTEDVWYEKMVEDYEEHEGETSVEPFLRN